jgi:tetratricopeptide (TPR) repeat protein
MKKSFLLLIFTFLLIFCFGQNYKKIDSLKQILSALPPLEGSDADTTRMKLYLDIGNLFEHSIPDSAIWWYSMAADTNFIPEKTKMHPEKASINATALRYIGIVLSNKGNYSEAVSFYERSLKISEELDDKAEIAKCLNNLGVVARSQGNYSEAVSFYGRSLKIFEELGDKVWISRCLNNLGIVAMYQGNYSEAVYFYDRSLKISEELGNKLEISKCLNNLGIVANSQGNYSDAVSFYERSLKIKEELGDKAGISSLLNNLGIVAYSQCNYSDAVSFYERSLKIKEELGDKAGISSSLNNLGIVARTQGNYSDAVSFYERSLKIREELGDKAGISSCLNNLGIVARNQGNYSDAVSYFGRSLKIDEELGDKAGISMCLINMGIVAYSQGNYSDAVSYYERSLKIREEIGDKAGLANNYPRLAMAYIKTGQINLAPELLQKSLTLTIWLLKDNFGIMSENDKELYLEKTKSIFNDINSFNINYPGYNDSMPGICYNNELILKGLLLKSSASIMDVVYNSPDPELKKTYFLLKQYRDRISSLQGTEKTNRDSLIDDLEKKANEQERKLVRLSSEFADIQKLFEYKWQDVQKALNQGEAAIEFVSFTQGNRKDTTVYVAMIITPDSKMPLTVQLFNNYELQGIIGKSTGTGYKYVRSLYNANSTVLYDLIWKPLKSELAGINTVYYAPSEVLNNISFPALSKESGVLLCDYIDLVQLSTTGKLIYKQCLEKTQNFSDAVVFGGIDYNPEVLYKETWEYLPGTLTELQILEKRFTKGKIKYSSYSGKEATEEAFKELFASKTSSPAILHISTHGFFYPDPELAKNEVEKGEVLFRGSSGFGNWMFVNNKNPMMRSGLVFAGANRVWSEEWGRTDNEGLLTAHEVSNMLMQNTQLVVLSACETGLGDIRGSEGVYGLQRAFKMAGAKYLIMSLWQVPDKETVEFMELFYSKLLNNNDIRKAFSETQREMRQKYDPFFWAAFVLVE